MNDLDLFDEPPRGGRGGGRGGRRAEQKARKRQRRRRRNGRAATLFALAFLVAVMGGGGLAAYVALRSYMIPPDYAGQGSGEVTVQIEDGDSVSVMGDRLERGRVVRSARAFVKVARKEPRAASIQPGYYRMRLRMSAAAALALLLDPKARAGNQITIPEGLRISQIVPLLARKTGLPQKDFQRLVDDPGDLGLPSYAHGRLEGYLYPGRYDLKPGASARELLTMMVDRFKKTASELELEDRARAAKTTPDKVITMASLIQAESGRHSDMPKISRVIFNRLRHKPPMYLKLDSTTLYGLNKFGIVASSTDIASPSRYNTYNHPGLPPGAISNPGEHAINAVFEPAKGDWLFFVATDPDRKITEYAETEQEFARLRAKLDKYLATHGRGGE
jgi:peptidoglycan lytic transglycosylase G